VKKVGDGTKTFLWTNPCLGGTPLCERFGRLFDLAVTKSSTVAEMFLLGRGRRGCGGARCGCGRRRWWGSVRPYFLS
jgi:hypothetical protein